MFSEIGNFFITKRFNYHIIHFNFISNLAKCQITKFVIFIHFIKFFLFVILVNTLLQTGHFEDNLAHLMIH